MQALYNKNPNSFLEQNLNHMQSGSYLKIPTWEKINRVNRQLVNKGPEQALPLINNPNPTRPNWLKNTASALKNNRNNVIKSFIYNSTHHSDLTTT